MSNIYESSESGSAKIFLDDVACYAPDVAVDNEYFSDAHELLDAQEDVYFWFRSRRKLLVALVKKWARNNGRYCEVGFGNAKELLAVQLACPGMRISGTEISLSRVKDAMKKLPECSFFQSNMLALPSDDYSFDCIAAFDVLEHIEDDVGALNSLGGCINKNGRLIITVPQHQWLWGVQDDLARHKRRYTRAEMRGKLEGAGFKVLWMSSYMAFLLPVMFVMRFLSRLRPNKGEVLTDEFDVNPVLNRVCEIISDIEVHFTSLGVRFPFGGSLICVAEKM